MSRRLTASLLAAAVALTPIPLIATATPAAAQVNVNVNIGFDYFYDQLSPYGEWNYHPRWGDVWRPTSVGPDFRPFFRGYWVNTEYGWTWNSQDPFGGIPYHYGRWVYDPYDGWLWIPGYTWSPAWVIWRGDDQNIGWFPMPPDERFLTGAEYYRDDWDWNRGYFGYADWYGPGFATGLAAAWTFVALDRFADRDFYRYVRPRNQIVNIVNNTTNITNYVTVNNRIVNRSVDVARVERASGRRIQQVEARTVTRAPINTVERGRAVATRERERHGGDVRAPARERVQRLDAAEARTPVRERRNARFQRDDQQQQQAQQPGAAKQGPADRAQQQQDRRAQQQQDRDAAQRAQTEQRERNAAQQREQRQQQQRDSRAQIEQQQRDQADQRNRAAQQREERAQQQQQQRERDNRAQIQRQQQQAEQQNRARAEQQQRARAEQQQRAEQQNRARAEQAQQRAEQQNRARAEQQQRAQSERQAQAEQQNRARAQQAERQQQQAAAQQQRQRRAQQQEQQEDEKQKRGRN